MEKKDSALRCSVIEAIKQIYDPELPVNIYDLGLIYEIDVDDRQKSVKIVMTLTTPSCPVADTLPKEVEYKVKKLTKANSVDVVLTFDPPYTVDRLTEEVKLMLGLL